MSRRTALRELSGWLPLPEWREASWAVCAWCEGSMLWGAVDSDEKLLESDHLVCPDCGALHFLGYDEDGPVAELTSDLPERLRPSALAGFRRLIRVRPEGLRDPWADRSLEGDVPRGREAEPAPAPVLVPYHEPYVAPWRPVVVLPSGEASTSGWRAGEPFPRPGEAVRILGVLRTVRDVVWDTSERTIEIVLEER